MTLGLTQFWSSPTPAPACLDGAFLTTKGRPVIAGLRRQEGRLEDRFSCVTLGCRRVGVPLTHDELKQDGADTPEVGLGVVLVEAQDLGRHVQRAAAQRLRQALRARQNRPRWRSVSGLLPMRVGPALWGEHINMCA